MRRRVQLLSSVFGSPISELWKIIIAKKNCIRSTYSMPTLRSPRPGAHALRTETPIQTALGLLKRLGIFRSRGTRGERNTRRTIGVLWDTNTSQIQPLTYHQRARVATTSIAIAYSYIINARSFSKIGDLDHLGSELLGYDFDLATVSETHFKKRHNEAGQLGPAN